MRYRINIPDSLWSEKFRRLRDDFHRYMVVYGSAGSGKSYSVAMILVSRLLEIRPFNLLVVRNTGRSNRDSTFALLNQIINKWNLNQLFTINKSDLRISCMNGNEVIFTGLDDVEKLKSITFTKGELNEIWIEEASEITEADFNQLDIRLRGRGTKKQIILTFNPIDVNHWLKRRFVDCESGDITVHHSTYLDNEFIDDDYRKLLESYKDTDPYYYNVYALGMWGVLGSTIFDANRINERLMAVKEPASRGIFRYSYDGLSIKDISFIEDANGPVYVYRRPESKAYVIGGDTAGEGSDYFVGQVLDQNGNQVAVLRQQTDSDLWTKQMYCLGKWYRDALLTIEVNFDSYPIQELQRLGYVHMYVREVNDTALDRYRKSYGFRTDSWTRPAILNHLIELVREHSEFINDRATLEEMLTFVRNTKGRMEAQNGAHDDLVMALAIAYEGIGQLRIPIERPKEISDEDEGRKGIDEYWG